MTMVSKSLTQPIAPAGVRQDRALRARRVRGAETACGSASGTRPGFGIGRGTRPGIASGARLSYKPREIPAM